MLVGMERMTRPTEAEAPVYIRRMSERVAFRTCPLCEATCGLEIRLVEEGVKVIRGDRENPFSQGFVCPKGTVLGRLHSDPDRVQTPLIKRDGVHVEATWEEAFAEVHRRIADLKERHGSQALALYIGNPNAHSYQNNLAIRPLAKSLGSPNIFSASTLDQMPKHVSAGHMFGSPSTIPVPDIDRTDLLVILGANPYESNGSLATAPDWPGRLEALRERGGRVVVVDPRRTKTAENADQHIPIVPGTDAALLMSIIHVLFDESLVDLGRLDGHVAGVDEVAAGALAFAPEAVAASTGVDAEMIRRLARDIAAADRAAVYGRIGTHTVEFGTVASWAVDVIAALTGNLDEPGGMMFPLGLHQQATKRKRGFQIGRWRSRVRELPEVLGELPAATMIDEMTNPGDGQIRALITVGGNPALTSPDSKALDEALASLEFMVSVDPYLNETTRHADVLLPPPSALEKSHYDIAFTTLSVRNYAMWSAPVFERPDGHPSEFDVLVTLTAILGGAPADTDPHALAEATLAGQVGSAVAAPGSPIEGRDPAEILEALAVHPEVTERFLDLMIRTSARGDGFGAHADGWTLERLQQYEHGVDLGPLESRIPEVLATPSGLVELAPEAVIADLERLVSTLGERSGGYVLVGRRELQSNNSWLHNIDVLVKGRNRCTLRIHPDDAERLSLADGSRATVASSVGEVVVDVEVNDEMMAGVVSLPYGWGHGQTGSRLNVASKRPGVNTNVLTDRTKIDPLSGNAVLNGVPVEIVPA
jgi:anaerobic selenocysteine-containing dehydrogenase